MSEDKCFSSEKFRDQKAPRGLMPPWPTERMRGGMVEGEGN